MGNLETWVAEDYLDMCLDILQGLDVLEKHPLSELYFYLNYLQAPLESLIEEFVTKMISPSSHGTRKKLLKAGYDISLVDSHQAQLF